MSETMLAWIRDLVTVLFGSLAGGVTNRIAILMLFHPYRPPRFLGRTVGWLQGAVPKNQARLAGTIGRTVGTRLLTPADVAAELRDERLREAFEEQLRDLVASLLEGEKPPLAELLPPSALPEARRLLETVLDAVRDRAVQALQTESFEADAERLLDTLAESLEDERLVESLGDARMAELRGRADEWLRQVTESHSFGGAVREYLDRAAARLLVPGRSFEELLPTGLVAAVERGIADYLPLAMERLGRLLEDPGARRRVEGAVHELLERFMRDLRFHQRVVAKLIITEETVDRVIDTLEAEGADRLGDLLRESEMQDAMARSVNEAIVDFLRRDPTDVLGRADSEPVQDALDSVAEWVTRAARDPQVRDFVLDRAETAVYKAGERSWADVVRLVPAGSAGRWAARGLEAPAGRQQWDRFRAWLVERILTQPVGSLDRYGRDGAADRLTAALADPVWDWISDQVPRVAAKVRVAERVETKIAEFPLPELERLVRSVTQNELNLIVRLGYLLGAFIGLALVLVRRLLV